MNGLKGKFDKGYIPAGYEDDYSCFINDFRYPQGISPKYYKSSIINYLFFRWVGKFITRILGGKVSLADYPPQPNPTEIRRYQLCIFSLINTYIAANKVLLSNDKEGKGVPRIVLKTTFSLFWDRILVMSLLSALKNIFDLGILILINKLIQSMVNESKQILWAFLYVFISFIFVIFRVLLESHTYFYISRIEIAVSYCISYSLFRIGFCKRREYDRCNCGYKSYSKTSKGILCYGKNKLYCKRYNVQMDEAQVNCENDLHKAKSTGENTLCPAQQHQCEELSKSMYTFFSHDVARICKILYAVVVVIDFVIQAAFSGSIIYSEIGYDSIYGIITLFVLLFLMIVIEFICAYLKRRYLPARDRRVSASYEITMNLQTIIMKGWEDVAINYVFSRRKDESKLLFCELFFKYIIMWISEIIQPFTLIVFFLTLISSSSDNTTFNPIMVISIMHAINLIHSPMSKLPKLMNECLDSFISMNRIDTYLYARYAESDSSNGRLCITTNYQMKSTTNDKKFNLTLVDANFSYTSTPSIGSVKRRSYDNNLPKLSSEVLSGINLQVKSGEVLILCGTTSSGKSSLIKAIMGELTLTAGEMSISALYQGKPIYYAPQNPWIPPGTLMSAIVSDYPYCADIYENVISVTELREDILEWTEGHGKVLDEAGKILSGGQKMRVSLAKTLYAFLITCKYTPKNDDTSLICLDDVLSKLDIYVSIKIFLGLFGQKGLFVNKNVSIIMSIDEYKLKVCWQALMNNKNYVSASEGNSCVNSMNWRVCELNGGKISKLTTVGEFLREKSDVVNLELSILDFGDDKNIPNDCYVVPINFNFKMLEMQKLIYKLYLKNAGYITVFLTLVLFICAYTAKAVFDIIVVHWSDEMYSKHGDGIHTRLPYHTGNFRLFVNKLLICFGVEMGSSFLAVMLCWYFGLVAANKYHNDRIISLLNNNTSMDKSICKLLTEFTMDQYIIDAKINLGLLLLLSNLMGFAFQIGIIVYLYPLFSLAFLFIIVLTYFMVLRRYITSVQHAQLNMLQSLAEVNSIISQGINDGSVIRALRKESELFDKFSLRSDYFFRIKFFKCSISNWAMCSYCLYIIPILSILAISPLIVSIITNNKFTCNPGDFSYRTSLFITVNYKLGETLYHIICLFESMCSLLSSHKSESDDMSDKKVTIGNGLKTGKSLVEANGALLNLSSIEASYKCYDNINERVSFFKCIRDVKASANAGDIIGIVGRTGSGKSSLLKSIKNMLKLDSGIITISSTPIVSMSNKMLRETIGVLPQFTFYFDEWALGDFIDPYHQYSFEEIKNALNELGMLNIILDKLPQNECISYNDTMGQLKRALTMKIRVETSVKSSEHQVAQDDYRLIFNDAQIRYLSFTHLLLGRNKYKVILIDEPPNIQNTTDSILTLQNLIAKYLQNCASLIVTHDYDYVKICNKLWVMSKGKIVKYTSPQNIKCQLDLARLIIM